MVLSAVKWRHSVIILLFFLHVVRKWVTGDRTRAEKFEANLRKRPNYSEIYQIPIDHFNT